MALSLPVAAALWSLSACNRSSAGNTEQAPAESEKPNGGAQENVAAGETSARSPKEVKDSFQEEIDAFRKETRLKYNNRKFDELEKLAAELRREKATFGNGSWKIYQFYQSFACENDEPKGLWEEHERIHKDWIAAEPESVTARIAYAGFLTDYAWEARGSGQADTVTEDRGQLFADRLSAAAEVLKEAGELPEKDPVLGRVFLTVALGQGWPKPVYDTMMEKLRSEEPTFWSYDLARAYSLLPRWHGEEGDWEAFADEAAARPNGLGAEIYARIVMEQRRYYKNVFRETKASWPKTREGLEILRKKYPDSLEFMNATALLAAMANDRELAKAMFDLLGNRCVTSFWKKPEIFTRYRSWAETGVW